LIGEFVKSIKEREDLKHQIAITALAVVFFARCVGSVEVVKADHVVWSNIAVIAFYAVGSYIGAAFVILVGTLAWLFAIEPYLRHLVRSPRETLTWTIGVTFVLAFYGWCSSAIGLGSGTNCEPDSRGGVYCEEE
jgi:hypothetical protein